MCLFYFNFWSSLLWKCVLIPPYWSRHRDRIHFYSQREKKRDLTSDQFKITHAEVKSEDLAQETYSYIYTNKSLTPANCRLLKAARLENKKEKYKHKGYTMTGQVISYDRTDDQSITYSTYFKFYVCFSLRCLVHFCW